MSDCYVLDACALQALLRNGPGADKVSDLLNAAFRDEVQVAMSKINLLEVYYDVYRYVSKDIADNVVKECKSSPVSVISEISDAAFDKAGRLKASYKISLADSIALAEAMVSGGALVTADHHEMDAIAQNEPSIKFLWIR